MSAIVVVEVRRGKLKYEHGRTNPPPTVNEHRPTSQTSVVEPSQSHSMTYNPFVNKTIIQIAKAYHAS